MASKYVQELAYQPDYYSDLKVWAYSSSHYYKKSIKENGYSYSIIDSKTKDISDHFFPKILEMFNELKKENKIQEFELIIVIPKSEKGDYSPTLVGIAKKLADGINAQFELVVERNRSLPKSRELKLKERFKRVSGSISLKRPLEKHEKRILILDDTFATGVSVLETAKILKENGAQEIVLFCLGINF